MGFIDYNKALDRLYHERMWIMLKHTRVPIHLVLLITNLRANQNFDLGKYMEDDCILTHLLFNIIICRENNKRSHGHIGGRNMHRKKGDAEYEIKG